MAAEQVQLMKSIQQLLLMYILPLDASFLPENSRLSLEPLLSSLLAFIAKLRADHFFTVFETS